MTETCPVDITGDTVVDIDDVFEALVAWVQGWQALVSDGRYAVSGDSYGLSAA